MIKVIHISPYVHCKRVQSTLFLLSSTLFLFIREQQQQQNLLRNHKNWTMGSSNKIPTSANRFLLRIRAIVINIDNASFLCACFIIGYEYSRAIDRHQLVILIKRWFIDRKLQRNICLPNQMSLLHVKKLSKRELFQFDFVFKLSGTFEWFQLLVCYVVGAKTGGGKDANVKINLNLKIIRPLISHSIDDAWNKYNFWKRFQRHPSCQSISNKGINFIF